MSTLEAEIKTAQAVAPPPVPAAAEAVDGRSAGLLIYLWDETEWMLPWAYFISAHYRPRVASTRPPRPALGGLAHGAAASPMETVEQIELTFMHHLVVVQGRNLKPLMEAIADMSLWVLRELSPDFAEMEQEPVSEAGEPVAAAIGIVAAVASATHVSNTADIGIVADADEISEANDITSIATAANNVSVNDFHLADADEISEVPANVAHENNAADALPASKEADAPGVVITSIEVRVKAGSK